MNIGELIASIGGDLKPLQNALNQAEREMQQSSNKMATSFKSFQKSIDGVATKLKSVGKSMSMAITLPMVGMATGAIKLSKDFESSMRKITGLVGVAKDQVNSWMGDVIKLAPELAKAPKELADALFFVTSAGIKGAAAIDVLKASAKASTAGLGETSTIADLVTSAMNAYGSETLNATQATDVLVAAVREGKAEASELAGSMGKVLPFSSELGVSFNEVGAAMAAMTRTGTNAAEAATSLRSIFSSFIKPSKQAEQALNSMGTSSAEFRKTLKEKGLLQALVDLKDLQKEYGDETLGVVIPNIRALSGVLDLMGANVKDNTQVFNNMRNVTGSLDNAFKSASETTEFQWNRAIQNTQSSLLILGQELQKVFIPILTKLSEKISQAAQWFSGLSTKGKQLVIFAGILVTAIGPLILAAGMLATAVSGLAGAFAVLSGPVGLVIAAVAALSAAFIYAYDNWEAIKERVSDINWWRNAIIDMIKFFIKINPFSAVIDAYNGLVSYFGGETIPNPFDSLNETLDKLKGKTKEYEHEFGSFGKAVKRAISDALNAMGILDGIGGAGFETPEIKQRVPEAIVPGMSPIKSGAEDFFQRRKEISRYQEALNSIPRGIKEVDLALAKLGDVSTWDNNSWKEFQSILKAYPSAVQDYKDGIEDLIPSMDELNKQHDNMLTRNQQIVSMLTETLSSAFDAALINGQNFFDVFIQGLGNLIKKLITALITATALAAILSIFTGGGATGAMAKLGMEGGGGFLGLGKGLFGNMMGLPGLAEGGIVPPGFPGDTYPALLSSNEMVLPQPIPLDGISNPMGSRENRMNVTVHGELGMSTIHFSNERYSKKKSWFE